MASVDRFEARKCWRVRYRLHLGENSPRQKARYCRTNTAARSLRTRVAAVEDATRTGVARGEAIKEWLEAGYLTDREAAAAFPGWAETQSRNPGLVAVEWSALLDAYEEYALRNSKAGDPSRKSHRNHMALARQVVEWLKGAAPDLHSLSAKDCERYRDELSRRYSQWSVHHHVTKLRIILDQAVDLGMIATNPARGVRMRTPKTAKIRRILSVDEARALLEASPQHGKWVYGGLATAVRLALYAGLRPEEICWARWEWLDGQRGTLTVQEARDVVGQVWRPKDFEARVLDVKAALVEWLAAARHDGPFILRSKNEGRPLSPDALVHSFRKMADAEGWDRSISLYSCRHTYATALLRAGVDLRTVQARMGHQSVRTTEGYLHALSPEERPTDRLPY